MSNRSTIRIAIIGGGISGLSAAWYLERNAAQQGIDLNYTLLEKSARWGGKVMTETVADYVIEAGPDSFLTQKPWALQLARDLGLEARLLGTNDHKRTVYVLKRGRPVPMPDGLMLVVPTEFMPFALSPLLSPMAKLRMVIEPLIPAKKDDEDETLAQFIRRRLGNEALDKLAEPLMAGIFNSDAERQSLLATFPRFRTMEKEHGSLTRAMLAAKRQRAAAQSQRGKKTSAFVSLRGGTQELIDALVPQLTGDLCLNTGVQTIEKVAEGYQLQLDDERRITVDQVLIATPAPITADLLQTIAPQSATVLKQIRYISTGTISLAFNQSEIKQALDGFGLVIPSSEKRPINAITVSSTKFDHRAPDDQVLLRVFFGGSRSPQSMQLDDEALLTMIREQLHDILGITAAPLLYRIYRWWHANPQYDIGHLERVDAIEAHLPDGLYLTGSAYRGIGMPDCVKQAQQISQQMIPTAQANSQ